MADDPNGNRHPPPPTSSSEPNAVRETFLCLVQDPHDAESLRRLGQHLWGRGGASDGTNPRAQGRPPIRRQVEAAADDLDHLVTFLEEAVISSASSDLSAEDRALVEALTEWLGHLSWMAVAMRRRVEVSRSREESAEKSPE